VGNATWRFYEEEKKETATKNKVWLINTSTNETALFKADYGLMKILESQAEVAVYETARKLGIS
jgi:hypothetical protein